VSAGIYLQWRYLAARAAANGTPLDTHPRTPYESAECAL